MATAVVGHVGMHEPSTLGEPAPLAVTLTIASVMLPPRGDVTLIVPVMGPQVSGSATLVADQVQENGAPGADM